MSDLPLIQADRAVPPPAATTSNGGRGRRLRLLSRTDRVVITLMVLVPLLLVAGLVWLPAVATVLLSGTNWDGIGPISEIEWVGLKNYDDVVNIYPPFVPAVQNNLLWLAALFVVATPFGMFLAVLLDKEIRGSRFYQTALYLPVVLSLALIGFVWQLIYSRDQGLLNGVFGGETDWYGDPNVNIWPCWSRPAGGTSATSCCSTWPASRASTRPCGRPPRSTAPRRPARSSGSSSR